MKDLTILLQNELHFEQSQNCLFITSPTGLFFNFRSENEMEASEIKKIEMTMAAIGEIPQGQRNEFLPVAEMVGYHVTNKKLDRFKSDIINFIGIQVVLTLILMGLLGVVVIEIKPIFKASQSELTRINKRLVDIHEDFMIFQEAIPYDPARKKRIDAENMGNYNEFDGDVEGGM